MPQNDDYDDSQDDSQQDDTQDDTQDTDNQGDGADPQQAMANAAPHEVQAHRGLIDEVLSQLDGQGVDTQALANQAGVGTTDASQMSHGDLISMARTLAQQHPEIMQDVAQQFPQAQGLLNSVLGGQGGGGGFLGGIIGKFFG
jgi:hypothetical protein